MGVRHGWKRHPGFAGGIRRRVRSESGGRITGRVTDPGGAVVVGAEVTATDQDAGVAHKAVSNATGIYAVPFLPP